MWWQYILAIPYNIFVMIPQSIVFFFAMILLGFGGA